LTLVGLLQQLLYCAVWCSEGSLFEKLMTVRPMTFPCLYLTTMSFCVSLDSSASFGLPKLM